MSAKNVLLGGSIILVILLMGVLIVTATFMLYESPTHNSVTGLVTASAITKVNKENPKAEALTNQSSGSTISEEEAIRIAENRLGGSFDLEEVDTGSYRGIRVWELEFESSSKEAEVIIDMETGEILDIEYEEEDDDED